MYFPSILLPSIIHYTKDFSYKKNIICLAVLVWPKQPHSFHSNSFRGYVALFINVVDNNFNLRTVEPALSWAVNSLREAMRKIAPSLRFEK